MGAKLSPDGRNLISTNSLNVKTIYYHIADKTYDPLSCHSHIPRPRIIEWGTHPGNIDVMKLWSHLIYGAEMLWSSVA